jgi:uroporphyrinogen-III decarboxylase
MLQGSPGDVYAAVISCQEVGGSRYFSAAGCEIPDKTPHDNLHAQSRALRDSTLEY